MAAYEIFDITHSRAWHFHFCDGCGKPVTHGDRLTLCSPNHGGGRTKVLRCPACREVPSKQKQEAACPNTTN